MTAILAIALIIMALALVLHVVFALVVVHKLSK